MRIRRPAWLAASFFAVFFLQFSSGPRTARGVELVALTEQNWEEYVPRGKEVDAIYGDYVLRNEHVVAVIAKDTPGRKANMTVRNVGGCIIDLTRREEQSDQLSAYYPAPERTLVLSEVGVLRGDDPATYQSIAADELADRLANGAIEGQKIWLRFHAETEPQRPDVRVAYALRDADDWVLVGTDHTNPHDQPVDARVTDALRLDGEFEMGIDTSIQSNLFWALDAHWGQAYGVIPVEQNVQVRGLDGTIERRRPVLAYSVGGSLAAKDDRGLHLERRIIPAQDTVSLKATAYRMDGPEQVIHVRDARGPAEAARIQFFRSTGGRSTSAGAYGEGKTDEEGNWRGVLPRQLDRVVIHATGRSPLTIPLERVGYEGGKLRFELPAPSYAVIDITDGDGQPVPCKVSFHGRDGTEDPNYGPDSAIHGVRNLWYTHNGQAKVEIAPGKYDVVISHGPEFDAIVEQITVERGKETKIEGRLVRTVNTPGWLSTEYHSHSSPSGDNTSSQRGRVLNLLAEHLEFIPCTEHNRVDTYVPHLKHFGALDRVLTCSGMELTGGPLPINHQNAFPLVHKPRTQDGGGPLTDSDPVVQIERLAMWDDGSDKLVQTNHPNIPQMVGDRDFDGTPDEGFEKMFGFMDVIEVHPPANIFTPPASLPPSDRELGNVIFHWMQLLNVGYRVPGVVNTDAHWNYHGSGWLRNYVKSSTDDPSQASVAELVHASEHGQIVMTNGPYLEVTASAGPNGDRVDVGGDLATSDGYVRLNIRVQCANWLDVNRVQVFVNGRPDEELDFRRATHPEMFASGVVKFEHEIPVKLEGDAHLIVATAGEGLTLGRVMGGPRAEDMPVAVTNPIFVDVDGGGFKPNGDMLGVPLRLPEGHTPSHGHDHGH